MNKRASRRGTPRPGIAALLVCCAYLLPAASLADTTIYADGLVGPVKLDTTGHGTLLVTESGTGMHDGRLSAIDRWGNVFPLVTGLPSGIEITGGPSGPTGVLVHGCCVVHLVIGDGDATRFALSGPPQMMPNPEGPSSPLFSSLLRLRFDRSIEQLAGGAFELSLADHDKLADGFTVRLENGSGEKVWITLAADVYDFRPHAFTVVRNSNPFAIAAGKDPETPVIVASGQNSLIQVRRSQPPRTLLRFPPVPNAPGTLPPVSEAVPTSIRHLHGDLYLVGLLSGVPFVPGHGSVRLVDVKKRTETPLISGVTSVTDVLRIGSRLYVLEYSTNLAQGEPGRLLRFKTPSSQPDVIAAGLAGPSGMTYSPKANAIFVAEIDAGQVRRVRP